MGTADNCCVPSFVCTAIAVGLFCIGVMYEDWQHDGASQTGLWKSCTQFTMPSGNCHWFGFKSAADDRDFLVVQIIIVIAGVCALAALILGMLPLTSGILQIIAALIGCAAVVVFALDQGRFKPGVIVIGWAYWTTVASLVLFLINGTALVVTMVLTRFLCSYSFGPCRSRDMSIDLIV